MKLEMTGHMRMEQRMKLAPHMIQSMEILQLPILALQERIEQELNSNPVLEIDEPTAPAENINSEPERTSDEFNSLDENYREFFNEDETYRPRKNSEQQDLKFEAIKNTEAPQQSLHEYLLEQWSLVEAGDSVKKAGEKIIDYIDSRGYLSVRLEQLHNKDSAFGFDDLQAALQLVQTLEPSGVGARDLAECLLIQMRQSGDDLGLEQKIVKDYMAELLENKLPDIAKKTGSTTEQVRHAIERMSRFDTSPGLQIGSDRNQPIAADVIVEWDDSEKDYIVRLADASLPSLRVSSYYENMAKAKDTNERTKKFLNENIRSAQWILEAIEQRKNTLLKVSRSIVKNQREFFDKGPQYLKPLPMATVANEVGVHLATVSRAVAGKYVQCERGILPLRKFFSGGTEDENGQSHSWEAIRAKLQQIIDQEDKFKPLSDDKILQKLQEAGIKNLARRTVAKYRGLMNIPTARFRKKY